MVYKTNFTSPSVRFHQPEVEHIWLLTLMLHARHAHVAIVNAAHLCPRLTFNCFDYVYIRQESLNCSVCRVNVVAIVTLYSFCLRLNPR